MNFKHLGCMLLTLGLAGLTGCGDKPTTTSPPTGGQPSVTSKPKADEDIHGTGPHKGIIEHLGNLHFEFVVDHGTKQATIYLYGPSEKELKPHAIKAENGKIKLSIKEPKFDVDMIAKPEAGDAAGRSSKFVAKDDRFGKKQDFAGEVIAVDEEPAPGKPSKPYSGEFDEKEAHHDHDEKK